MGCSAIGPGKEPDREMTEVESRHYVSLSDTMSVAVSAALVTEDGRPYVRFSIRARATMPLTGPARGPITEGLAPHVQGVGAIPVS